MADDDQIKRLEKQGEEAIKLQEKFLDYGGLDHSKVKDDLTQTSDGVETYVVDANYTDSDTTKYIGKVKYDDDYQTLEEAVESEDVHIDSWASEDEKLQLDTAKEESDVDVALNLEAESQRGK